MRWLIPKLFYPALFLCCGGIIAWLSIAPAMAPPADYDKLLHSLAYCGFLLAGVPLVMARGGSASCLAWLSAAVFFCGLALEAAQHFVPGRTSSALDLVANTVGIGLGVLLAILIKWTLTRRLRAFERQESTV